MIGLLCEANDLDNEARTQGHLRYRPVTSSACRTAMTPSYAKPGSSSLPVKHYPIF